jgi:uncharacterized metal-binding protein
MASFFQDSLNKAKLSFVRADPGDDVEEQQPDRLEELAEYCPTLTFQQRLIGFAVCFGMGCTWVANFLLGSSEISILTPYTFS